jgi:hypothetical protein
MDNNLFRRAFAALAVAVRLLVPLLQERIHLSFPTEGGRAAEAFQSLFSHTDGKIRDGYCEGGCGRNVVGLQTQHSSYLWIWDEHRSHDVMVWVKKTPHQVRRHRG